MVSEASLELPNVSAIPGTMKIHQLITVCHATVHFRDISCFCSCDVGLLTCDCYSLKEFNFNNCENVPKASTLTDSNVRADTHVEAELQSADSALLQTIQIVTESMIGRFCLVKYDQKLYPGKYWKYMNMIMMHLYNAWQELGTTDSFGRHFLILPGMMSKISLL